MSERTVLTIDQALQNFADGHRTVELDDSFTAVEREAIEKRRGWEQDTLSRKNFYVAKGAEKIANRANRTFRNERRIASLAVNGKRWQRVLVHKDSDLTLLITSIVDKIERVEKAIEDPDSRLEKYVPYFEMKSQAAARMLLVALQTEYNGEACWGIFANVQSDLNKALTDLDDITSGKVIPATVRLYMAEMDKTAAEQTEKMAA